MLQVPVCIVSEVNTVEPPIKDTPNKGHNRKNLSIKDTLMSQKFTFLLYFNLRREDNLSIKDKMPGPKMSIIRRFHCMCWLSVRATPTLSYHWVKLKCVCMYVCCFCSWVEGGKVLVRRKFRRISLKLS